MEEPTIGSELLKVDRRGHVRVPRVRREALLDEYERCGVSAAEFAAYIGVKYSTFCHWKRCRDQERTAAGLEAKGTNPEIAPPVIQPVWIEAVPDRAFAPVNKAEDDARIDLSSVSLPIILPGGARLEVSHRGQLPLTVRLLQMLGRQEGEAC